MISFMRRKAVIASATFISSCLLLLALWHTSGSPTTWKPHQVNTEAIGSPWIEANEQTEDKVIVVAKMREENVSWVFEGLPS